LLLARIQLEGERLVEIVLGWGRAVIVELLEVHVCVRVPDFQSKLREIKVDFSLRFARNSRRS